MRWFLLTLCGAMVGSFTVALIRDRRQRRTVICVVNEGHQQGWFAGTRVRVKHSGHVGTVVGNPGVLQQMPSVRWDTGNVSRVNAIHLTRHSDDWFTRAVGEHGADVSELDYLVGDVFDRLREIPDASIDLIVTSPPFLALRSYLPADHPDKHREIGSEATPAAFLDRLLELSAEWGRVLAPHGSLCVELGDTYANNGGPSGDSRGIGLISSRTGAMPPQGPSGRHVSRGWPLTKSLTGIPTLYPWSLAYGRNLLTGQDSPAGRWRIRNMIVWARPNPPVGALGDKFRPATSYITVACRGARRFFDLDAVRTDGVNMHQNPNTRGSGGKGRLGTDGQMNGHVAGCNAAGAPPLDWHTDDHPEDGDWLWKLSTQPYRGAHYATFPLELPTRLIMAMCPLRVCVTCGKPSERITENNRDGYGGKYLVKGNPNRNDNGSSAHPTADYTTLGWSDCGHNTWRTGRVLDPFAGSGTTLQAAQNVGRHAIGIDLDPRNGDLAQDRVGMFLEVNP